MPQIAQAETCRKKRVKSVRFQAPKPRQIRTVYNATVDYHQEGQTAHRGARESLSKPNRRDSISSMLSGFHSRSLRPANEWQTFCVECYPFPIALPSILLLTLCQESVEDERPVLSNTLYASRKKISRAHPSNSRNPRLNLSSNREIRTRT